MSKVAWPVQFHSLAYEMLLVLACWFGSPDFVRFVAALRARLARICSLVGERPHGARKGFWHGNYLAIERLRHVLFESLFFLIFHGDHLCLVVAT